MSHHRTHARGCGTSRSACSYRPSTRSSHAAPWSPSPRRPRSTQSGCQTISSVLLILPSGPKWLWPHCRQILTPGYDPFACTAIMGHESYLPMGVCVTDAVRRRAPDVVRSALTLHQLCRGGFTLGVGAGEAGHLVPFGYDFSAPVAELEAFLNELVTLLNNG